MLVFEDKKVGFLLRISIGTICFQLVYSFFYFSLPNSIQAVLISLIPSILISLYFLRRILSYKTASFIFLFSLFIHQTLTFYLLSGFEKIYLGSTLMMGLISIAASFLIGYRWGIFFTALVVFFVYFETILAPYLITFFPNSSSISNPSLYTIISLAQPAIGINYLFLYFYHTLIKTENKRNDLQTQLERVLDNTLQSNVLINKNKKIEYADTKTKNFIKQYLNLEVIEGEKVEKYLVGSHLESFNINFKKALEGEKVFFERKADFTGNPPLWLHIMYSPIQNSIGEIELVQLSLLDISANKLNGEELKKAEERWKYALTSSKDGVWDWSVKDGKTYFSRMWKAMLGYEDNEIENLLSEWERLIHPDDKERAFEEVMKHMKNVNENYILEHRLLCKNGEYKWVLARGKIIERDENNNPVRFIGTHTDIDPIKKVEQELKAAQLKAEKAAEEKSLFLSTMSHEIRTPLNAVIGFSNLLISDNLNPENTEYLENIQTSANHLLSLINNVLDVSKIESGKVIFEKREIDLEKLLNENIAMLSLRAKEKNIELVLGQIPSLDYYLLGDPYRLTQVLNNLLGNALKFTQKGNVKLYIEVQNEDKKRIELKFYVSDTGVGIPKNKIETIFEGYSQANSDTTRRFGGTGLGLTISKHVIDLQGGTIGVTSKVQEGSTFYFSLLFEKGKTINKDYSKPIEDKEKSLEGLKILIAEDNIFNTKLISRYLEIWGASISVAENGQEVLDYNQKDKFDVILMDLHMPIMDGYEATNTIRKQGNKIQIIALTASDHFASKEEMLKLGFNGYAVKPIDTKDLYKQLKDIWKKAHSKLPEGD